ncbi:MAG: hypothetical protein HW421_1977 [Ignavibacteria bacterium]|nr:hypothetical protein [Ignavibacteria bacterium]
MEAKALLNFKEGTVELSGSENFISQYLDKFKDSLISVQKETSKSPIPELEIGLKKVKEVHQKKGRKTVVHPEVTDTASSSKEKDDNFTITFKNKAKKPKTPKVKKLKPEPNNKFSIQAEENIPSLQEFLNSKNALSNSVRFITVVGYYITKFRGAAYFSPANIEFAYSALEIKDIPKYITNTFQNIKTNNGFIENIGRAQWILTSEGVSFVEMLPKFIRKAKVLAIPQRDITF